MVRPILACALLLLAVACAREPEQPAPQAADTRPQRELPRIAPPPDRRQHVDSAAEGIKCSKPVASVPC